VTVTDERHCTFATDCWLRGLESESLFPLAVQHCGQAP
jgi:hypothetical protein